MVAEICIPGTKELVVLIPKSNQFRGVLVMCSDSRFETGCSEELCMYQKLDVFAPASKQQLMLVRSPPTE